MMSVAVVLMVALAGDIEIAMPSQHPIPRLPLSGFVVGEFISAERGGLPERIRREFVHTIQKEGGAYALMSVPLKTDGMHGERLAHHRLEVMGQWEHEEEGDEIVRLSLFVTVTTPRGEKLRITAIVPTSAVKTHPMLPISEMLLREGMKRIVAQLAAHREKWQPAPPQ